MTRKNLIDWVAAEELFFNKSLEAVDRLQQRHASVSISFFAFRSNYYYGKNSVALDSYENALGKAKEHQEWVIRNRHITMTHPNSATNARYHWESASERIVDYTPDVGEFWKPDFIRVNCPDWESFFRGDDFDENKGSQGHVIVLFWRVLERLAKEKAFQKLNLAPLFRLGFQFEDDDLGLVVGRILTWPSYS